MFKRLAACTVLIAGMVSGALIKMLSVEAQKKSNAPTFTGSALNLPADYREWIYLTSGLDMTYNTPDTGAQPPSHSIFDNVFVNPESYRVYIATGTWPDKTTFVLENRVAEKAASINKAGSTQGAEIRGLEFHVKDRGAWAFYFKDSDTTAKLIAKPASCYTCHEAHAASDTTFVQFYPTLLPIAREKKTLSAAYLAESSTTK